jgi:hypothetical protein
MSLREQIEALKRIRFHATNDIPQEKADFGTMLYRNAIDDVLALLPSAEEPEIKIRTASASLGSMDSVGPSLERIGESLGLSENILVVPSVEAPQEEPHNHGGPCERCDAAESRIAQLEQERDEDGWHRAFLAKEAEIDTLRGVRDALRAKLNTAEAARGTLQPYVQHASNCETKCCRHCGFVQWMHDYAEDFDGVTCLHRNLYFVARTKCTCGLASLLTASQEVQP